jgi:hypothetical protein
MRTGDEYAPCCRATAADADVWFCPECGRALLRCQTPGCGGLLTPLGHCGACLNLGLALEPSAVLRSRAGERASLPFVLANRGAAPVSIKNVLVDTAGFPPEAVPLPWERLDPGKSRAFTVTAGPFPHGGITSVRLTFVAEIETGVLEEVYAFSGEVSVDVEAAAPTQVFQHVQIQDVDFGTGGMVAANPHLSGESRRDRHQDALGVRTDVPLERAERFELQQGHRGYKALGARMPRDVVFQFAGFPASDRPPDGPLVARPVIRCGRNGRPQAGRADAESNDLCLRVYEAATGKLDRDASKAISGRVCEFVLSSQRLSVRSVGRHGLVVNGELLPAGETSVVGPGETFTVISTPARTLAFRTAFTVTGGLITHVRIEKLDPAAV